MKIKTVKKSYEEVVALPKAKHVLPRRPSIFFRTLVRILSQTDLIKARFRYTGSLDKKNGPYFVLMNHSSFIDLKIASKILYPMPYHIVCTHDAMVGKEWLMRKIGCIPTKKFVSDLGLIRDIKHAISRKTSVLMYPEAGYTFDGRATAMPKLGKLFKMLDVPVAFIETKGAFARDPLYNGLQIRRVPVSADVRVLLSREEVRAMSVEEIDARVELAFAFDNFAWQREYGIKIAENFRADGLERILYRCAHCGKEGEMVGEGIKLTCRACKKSYTLTELGELSADSGETEFSHIPDWYAWQRAEVRRELQDGTYALDVPVDIAVMTDYKALYQVGSGRLVHTLEGFYLEGCDGKLEYRQPARASFGLNADYFWYELGDIICIGNSQMLYYCFPPKEVPVAKARLAAEELYKLHEDRAYHLCHEMPHQVPVKV